MPMFGRIRYRQLYPGVDAIFYGQGDRLEFDLDVAPGSDARSIRLRIDGASAVARDGDLVIGTAAGNFRIARPVVYQTRGGRRVAVSGRFRLRGNLVSFDIGRYDRGRPLVIDPVLAYSTYLSDSEDWAITTDAASNLYVTGGPSSGTFVATPGAINTKVGGVAVTKLDPTGMVVYRARLGGVANSGANGIAVDVQGDTYITGIGGNDYPTTPNAFEPNFFFLPGPSQLLTGFATEINPTGTALLYSTFISIRASVGYCNGIAVDSAHDMYITGQDYAPARADLSTNTGGGGYVVKLKRPIPLAITQRRLKRVHHRKVRRLRIPGTPLPTTAVSDTILTATVAASQVPSSAAAQVMVVNPTPDGGTSARSSPLAMTTTQPTVTIGGMAISGDGIRFSGISSGFDGLYQVNVQVPANAPTRAAIPLSIAIGGEQSNVVTVAIQ